MTRKTQGEKLPPGARIRGGKIQVLVYRGYDAGTKRRLYASRTVDTPEEAWRAWAELKREVESQEYVPPARLTVSAFLDQYLKKVAKPNLKPNTYRRYESIVETHLKPALGSIRLDRLTPVHVEGLLASLKGKRADATRLYVYRVLHRALEVAVRWKILGRNICDQVEPPKADEPHFYVLSVGEVERILKAVRGELKPPEKPRKKPLGKKREEAMAADLRRLYPFFLAAIHTGMRLSELLALQWTDVDFTAGENGTIWVRRSLLKGGEKPVFTSPKNRKARDIPMTPELAAALRAWQVEQELERAAFGQDYQDFGLVFCQPNGRPLDARSLLRHYWSRVKAAAGLPEHVRLHDLRHTFVSRALAAGANPRAVSDMAGHHDPGFTLRRYGHALRSDREDVARRLSEYLANGRKG